MPRLLNFYKLREGVDVDAFKEWSRTVDQPTCRKMPSCQEIEILMVTGVRMGDQVFDVIENIDVESFEAWQAESTSAAFDQVNNEWPNWGDEQSVISVYCEPI